MATMPKGKMPDTPQAVETVVNEAAQAILEGAPAAGREKSNLEAEMRDAFFSENPEMAEKYHAYLESQNVPLTAEEAALRRRLNDPKLQNEAGTLAGEMLNKADLKSRFDNQKRMLANGSSRTLLDPRVDKYSPAPNIPFWDSDDAAKHYNNVGPGRQVVTIRRPDIHKGHLDDMERMMLTVEDAHIVTRKKDGKPVYDMDAVLVSIPKIYQDAWEEADQETHADWDNAIQHATQHGSISRDDPDLDRKQQIKAAEARERSRQMGVGVDGNSPTAGWDLATAERFISFEETVAMEARARSGSRHHSYEEMQEIQEAAGKGKATFGGLQGSKQYNKWETSKDKGKAAGARK